MPDPAIDIQPQAPDVQTPPQTDNTLPAAIANAPSPQPVPPASPDLTYGPLPAASQAPPPPQSFREGMESVNPSYTTDASGNVVSTAPVRTPSTKGVLGQILMGALLGAQRGLAAETPEGAKGRGAAFSAGARAAEQGRIAADTRARAIAQQNFLNRQAVVNQKLAVQKTLAETAHITQLMRFEKDQEPGIVRAQKLKNDAAALQIQGANTRLLTDAATAIDTLAKLDIPFQMYTEMNPALNAQVPALVGGNSFAIQNGKRGTENGVAIVPKSSLQVPVTSPVMYNTYDGARDKDGAPIPTEHVITPDGKTTMLDWLQDYYNGRRQLYQMQQKTSTDMTLQQHKSAVEAARAKAGLEGAQAALAEAEAQNLKDMGINLPSNFKKPDGFTMTEDQLKQNLAQQGVQIPAQFDQYWAVGHYLGNLDDYPERITKGTPGPTRGQVANAIRNLGINPKFDEKTFPAIRKQTEEYASSRIGTAGGNIIAFNTGLAHLDKMDEAARLLRQYGNSATSLPAWNKIANFYGLQTGATPQVVFNTIHAALDGEIGKTYEGGKPDVETLAKIDKSFNDAMSQGQLDTFAKTTAALMQSKNAQLAQQYYSWTGQLNPNALNPETIQIYKNLGLNPYQGLPQGAQVAVGGTGNKVPVQQGPQGFPIPSFTNKAGQTFPLNDKGQFTFNGWIWQAKPDGTGATALQPAPPPVAAPRR
jgi:hypothetical protein